MTYTTSTAVKQAHLEGQITTEQAGEILWRQWPEKFCKPRQVLLSAADVQKMPLVERIRRIKVLTPGRYDLHSWVDYHGRNGALVDSVLLTVANGGVLMSGVPG